MKRTTLILEDAGMREVRELAREENGQISNVVNDLLRDGITRLPEIQKNRKQVNLPVFQMGKPKANLADRNAVEELMER